MLETRVFDVDRYATVDLLMLNAPCRLLFDVEVSDLEQDLSILELLYLFFSMISFLNVEFCSQSIM